MEEVFIKIHELKSMKNMCGDSLRQAKRSRIHWGIGGSNPPHRTNHPLKVEDENYGRGS